MEENNSNDIEFNKIPLNVLSDYNIGIFNSVNEIFNFLFDEDYTKEDIIAMLTDEMKEKLVLLNENVRQEKDKFYYGQDICFFEDDVKNGNIKELHNKKEKHNRPKVKFFTKIVRENPKIDNSAHNGEMVEILEFHKGRDIHCDRYTIRFNDGTIAKNIMNCELDFDYYIEGDRLEVNEEEEL